ncbi:MAG: DNA sulfur modification protein DndD [Acidimicrobiaceae bacterium]|nr:DNA sulfur modification protein DndD [Acidimicrobiaceae bacterium]
MRLHSLTLDNIGVYRGAQTVRFSTLLSKPITLIEGKNGTGKTSLLDSIPLVLYGNRARRILNGMAYGPYLHNLVHHGERSASISLEFDRTEDGRTVSYVVKRAWRRTSRGRSNDRLKVTTNGELRSDLIAAWPEFVEGILPMAVADLTIFDGEKVEALADPASSTEILRTSLFGLLGLDLVDRLRSDLQHYRRRTAKAHDAEASNYLQLQLSEAERLLSEAREQLDTAAQVLDVAQSLRSDLEEHLHQATDKLARAGGGLHAERDALNRQLAESNMAGDTTERELFQLAASDLPLTLIPSLLKAVVAARDQHDAAVLSNELRSQMESRDGRLVGQLETQLRLDKSAAAVVRRLFESDLHRIEPPAPPEFMPTDDAAETSRSLLRHRGSELQAEARRLTEALSEHHTESERLERMLAAAPVGDTIAAVVQDVANAEAELRVAERAVERALLEYSDANRRIEQAQRSVDNLAHDILNAGAADVNAARIAREITAADAVLTEFADHMIQKHLGRITDAINSSLRELLRKSGLVDGVLIDPSDLSVTLLDEDDRPLDAQRLSAGERQIVATAVLWGLSQCTGMTLPTVIDSPVGRLDRSHRASLVDRYFPQASRQVVLLSTDEEIVGEHLQQLLPSVGAQYRLAFDETEGFTSIVETSFDE